MKKLEHDMFPHTVVGARCSFMRCSAGESVCLCVCVCVCVCVSLETLSERCVNSWVDLRAPPTQVNRAMDLITQSGYLRCLPSPEGFPLGAASERYAPEQR